MKGLIFKIFAMLVCVVGLSGCYGEIYAPVPTYPYSVPYTVPYYYVPAPPPCYRPHHHRPAPPPRHRPHCYELNVVPEGLPAVEPALPTA